LAEKEARRRQYAKRGGWGKGCAFHWQLKRKRKSVGNFQQLFSVRNSITSAQEGVRIVDVRGHCSPRGEDGLKRRMQSLIRGKRRYKGAGEAKPSTSHTASQKVYKGTVKKWLEK